MALRSVGMKQEAADLTKAALLRNLARKLHKAWLLSDLGLKAVEAAGGSH